MSANTKVLTSQNAATAIPSGSAIPTVNSSGMVTMVDAAKAINPTVVSTLTPQFDTEWLRVAVCEKSPFLAIISVIGVYAEECGDGKPMVFAFGGSSTVSASYVNAVYPIVNSGAVSAVRIVKGDRCLYVDLQFHAFGTKHTIGLVGGFGLRLLQPTIAPANVEADKCKIHLIQ